MTNPPMWKRVARIDEVSGPGPHAVAADDLDIVLVRTPSGLRAYEGRCPHRGALLGEGELHDGALVCRNHRWRFDTATGQREDGPECLRACPAREEKGHVLVDVASLVRAKTEAFAAHRRIEDLPGPPVLPLIGSSHLIALDRLHIQLEEWTREYGAPYKLGIGPRTVVVFSDMDEMLPVLRDRPETFRRGAALAPVFEELGVDGLFAAEGRAWRPQRRLSMEALSHRHLRSFYPTLATVAERLRARWQRAAERGDVLDLPEELKRFTVDVTTQLVFGYDIDTLSREGDVIQEKLGLLLPAFNRRIFAVFPWWRLVRLPSDRELERALAELRVWLEGLVRDAHARLAADPSRAERPANFLEAMLIARDDKGEPFDDDAIFANAVTMLLAGEDTTAYTLAWCVHHLLDAPGDVRAMREELDRLLGDAAVPPDIETANRLAYAGAVANEAMRLRPVAPMLFHDALVDTVVGGVHIPKGTTLALMLRPPAMSAENFGDPEEFRPARWIDETKTGGAHEPSAHQPFGSGPRICPGRTLALLEMKLVLATLYQSFDVERVGTRRAVREKFAFTMSPTGLEVRMRSRPARAAESDAPRGHAQA